MSNNINSLKYHLKLLVWLIILGISLHLLVPLPCLLLILFNILLLELPHPLDLIQVYHKAFVI